MIVLTRNGLQVIYKSKCLKIYSAEKKSEWGILKNPKAHNFESVNYQRGKMQGVGVIGELPCRRRRAFR